MRRAAKEATGKAARVLNLGSSPMHPATCRMLRALKSILPELVCAGMMLLAVALYLWAVRQ